MRFEALPEDLALALSAAQSRLHGEADLRYCSEVESTNDIALSLAATGAAHGTAVLADVQRAGRGRRGRAWFSPPGSGMYLSVVVRLEPRAKLSLVTLAAGVAAANAVRATTGLPVELKWPNDLVIGRPWLKMGGLLCESSGVGSRVDAIVTGIGVNIRAASYPAEIADRATSIEVELGRPVDRAPLVVETIARLLDAMAEVGRHHESSIVDQWRTLGRAGLGGASVRWHDQNGEREGLAHDIDDEGALLVESGGRIERLVAGEVRWERLSHG